MQAFSFFVCVVIDLNLPAFISLKMFQIKWMNLRAAVEWVLKRLCSPQETPYSWIHNHFYTLSTCSSRYNVTSLNVSRLWSSAEFRGALTYFAQADCIPRSTAKVNDLMITAEDIFAGRSSLTELLNWWWTLLSSSFIHPCTLGKCNLLTELQLVIYQQCLYTYYGLGQPLSSLGGGTTVLVTLKYF